MPWPESYILLNASCMYFSICKAIFLSSLSSKAIYISGNQVNGCQKIFKFKQKPLIKTTYREIKLIYNQVVTK